MATFVFKVFTLAIRTASKPLASRFQNYILAHPTLRPQVLKFAQGIHALDFAMTRFAEGKAIKSGGSRKFVATLDDDRAMDLAGKFVSEGFVLAVAVGVLAWDYARSANKDEAKRRKEEEYRARVDKKFESFHNELAEQGRQNELVMAAIKERQENFEQQIAILFKERPKHEGWKLWNRKEAAI